MTTSGPTYVDYQFPLQKAIFQRLEASDLKDLDDNDVPVTDFKPTNCPFPYVQIGINFVVGDFSTKCIAGMELSAQIDVWSRYKGFKEVDFIAGQVLKAITQSSLDLSEFKMKEVNHQIGDGESMRINDGETVRRMVRIRFMIQDTLTPQ